ncbi:MAG: hypothetical protein QW803_12215 [Candidatus Methanomethylicia archaeon]
MIDEEILLDILKKKLVIRPWIPIVIADIISEKIIPKQPTVSYPPTIPQPVTRIVDLKEMLISRDLTLLDIMYGGKLHELILCSNNKNYSVKFITDKVVRIDKSFTELQLISPYIDTISAFEENGKFILHIKDFSWANSAHVSIIVKEPITFYQIFIKYDEFIK